MRSFLAGLILFSVAAMSLAPSAKAQATGQVLGIGFGNYYRPDCWAPLRVQLHSDSSDARNYMIQVHQQDLDKDTVVYTRVVALGPKPTTQDYFVYFVPQPTDNGLPDGDPKALAEALKVYLYDESGKTLITALPITFGASNIDPAIRMGSRGRGQKLVLAVTGDHDRPSWSEYRGALGLSEGIEFVNVTVDELPNTVLGYQPVDAIVWFDAQTRDAAQGGSGAFEAMQQWVREGGQLVICQPEERGKIAAFADAGMLPVEAKNAEGQWLDDFKAGTKPDLEPLRRLAINSSLQHQNPLWGLTDRNWDKVKATKQTFQMFHANAKPDAVVDEWINWDGTKDKPGYDNSPYIARRAYGMGAVTWVAQDIGNPRLTSVADAHDPTKSWPTGGWPYVWDRVFGWKNDTIILDDYDRSKDPGGQSTDIVPHPEYASDSGAVELGSSLLGGLQASARGIWLVTVAIFFFIVYWIVAGPGSYLFLASRKRTGMSWTVFAVAALVATVITVGVVKLVLRGDPEVHHVTIVRLTPDAPAADGSPRFAANISSRFGLYIPRDGEQTVELPDASTAIPSYAIPLALHPLQMPADVGFTDTARYDIATDALTSGDVSVRFPYRSTLKKIETQWNGSVAEGITGSAQLIPQYGVHDPADKKNPNSLGIRFGPLKGTLVNATGRDLHDVYFAFNVGRDFTGRAYFVLYVRYWAKGAPLDLNAEYQVATQVSWDLQQAPDKTDSLGKPFGALKGYMSQTLGWGAFWFKGLEVPSMGGDPGKTDDADKHYVRSFPMLAFFEDIGPYKGEKSEEYKRAELFRHGGRRLDVAPLLATGRLVVLAQADGAVPFPLKVNGSPIEGEGITFYEISLPLENKTESEKLIPPPPSTVPASAPSPPRAPARGAAASAS